MASSFEDFDSVHLILSSIAMAFLLAVYSIISYGRTQIKNSFLLSLPRRCFGIPEGTSDRMLEEVHSQISYCNEYSYRPPFETIADQGWDVSDPGNPVKYKTIIASSSLVVEEKGSALLNCSRSVRQSLREYVESLLENSGGGKATVFYKYIDYYERARYSPQEFSRVEYDDFLSVFKEMIRALNPTFSSSAP